MGEEIGGNYPWKWAAMTSITGKVGTTETLRRWYWKGGEPTNEASANEWNRVKMLEREVRSCGGPTRSCTRHRTYSVRARAFQSQHIGLRIVQLIASDEAHAARLQA